MSAASQAYITGERVYLRGLRREDMDLVGRWWDNPDATRYMESGWRPATESLLEAIYESSTQTNDTIVMVVVERGTDRAIGTCGLYQIFWPGRRAEFRIFLGEPDVFDKGYGTEATRLMLEYGFQRLNMEVIHLGVNATNTRAVRAYEKAGFVHEGVRRRFVYCDGLYHDAVVMSVLRSEFDAAQ